MSLSKPIGAKLWLGSLATSISQAPGNDSGPSTPIDPKPVNLVPVLDFTQWKQSGVYGMTEVKSNTFTNQATSGIALDIGAEAGKTYTVSFTMSRGAGALRLYISEEGTITTNDDVHDLTPGETTVDVVASGPWLTFRASVGDTTTTIDNLTVYEKVATPPVDFDTQLQSLIDSLKSSGDLSAMYVPKPVLLGQQVMFQDAAGSVPVSADGDPVGMLLDLSQEGEGGELINNGGPGFTDTAGWVEGTSQSFLSVESGALRATFGTDTVLRLYHNIGGASAIRLQITFRTTVSTANTAIAFSDSSAFGGSTEIYASSDLGEHTIDVLALNPEGFTNLLIGSEGPPLDGEYIEIVAVSAISMPGNHATQSTSAARPSLSTSGITYDLDDSLNLPDSVYEIMENPGGFSTIVVYTQPADSSGYPRLLSIRTDTSGRSGVEMITRSSEGVIRPAFESWRLGSGLGVDVEHPYTTDSVIALGVWDSEIISLASETGGTSQTDSRDSLGIVSGLDSTGSKRMGGSGFTGTIQALIMKQGVFTAQQIEDIKELFS